MTKRTPMAYTRRKALFSATVVAAMAPLFAGAQTPDTDDERPHYVLGVDGMACPFCSFGVEKKLSAIEGVAELETSILAGTVSVIMAPGKTLREEEARQAVEEAGFDLRDFKDISADDGPGAS